MAIPNNCYIICDYYYFDVDSKYECTLSKECPLKYNKLISDKEKCIDDCKMDDKYIYNYNNNCLAECPENTKKYEEEKICLEECHPELFEYNNICYNDCPNNTKRIFIYRNLCIDNLPENYYFDNVDNMHKECYSLCKECSQKGDDSNNNCDECISNYTFIADSSLPKKNCYKECDSYYYINEYNQISCTQSLQCSMPYNLLIT